MKHTYETAQGTKVSTLLVSGARTDLGPKGATGWTDAQREHLQRCVQRGDTIAYWCSDAHGRPANHTTPEPLEPVHPGMVQELVGPEPRCCSSNGLHATFEPHRWHGSRVWVVALAMPIDTEHAGGKAAALRREIIGEVLPEHCWDTKKFMAKRGY